MHDATMLGLITKLATPFITVHQERCAMVRNRNANCLRCADACTSGCIAFDEGRLSVSPERCIGCGTCATVCPTCALEAHHPNDAHLENRCLEAAEAADGRVCVACERLLAHQRAPFDARAVVRVECLGRIEESLLTALTAQGVTSVVLARHACEACEHVSGWTTAQAVCETERLLLDAWNAQLDLQATCSLPDYTLLGTTAGTQEDGSATKPSPLAGLADDAATEESSANVAANPPSEQEPRYTKVMADGTLPHFVPDRRERLLDALASLGEPNDVTLATRLWGRVSIDTETCCSCRMCATFCPTGALANFEDEDGSFGVEHYPGDCVKCRSCESICPSRALRVDDDVRAVDMVAGTMERFEMKPLSVERGQAHSIWHLAQTFTNTAHVYER